MALINNLVVSLKDLPALAEAMAQRQPGDKLTLTNVEVTVVENLAERASFDVTDIGGVSGADTVMEDTTPASTLEASVLGVMSKKSKK